MGSVTRRARWVRGGLRLGLLLAGGALLGCSSDETSFAEGVRIDLLDVRDIAVQVATDTATVTWSTRDARDSVLNYGLTTSLGTLATVPGSRVDHRVDLTGLTADTLYFFRVADGGRYRFRTLGGTRTRIAFVSDREDDRREVYLAYDLGENVTRLTTTGGTSPALSRDGTRVAWVASGAGGLPDVFTATLDAAGLVAGSVANETNTAGRTELNPDWSPDGTTLAFSTSTVGEPSRIVLRTVATDAETVPVDNGAANDQPAFSPDGASLAFASTARTAILQLAQRPIDGATLSVVERNDARTPVPAEQYRVISEADGTVDFSGSGVVGQQVLITYQSVGTTFTDERYRVPRPQMEINVIATNGSGLRRLTDRTGADIAPAWHPAGDRIVFVGEADGATSLLLVPVAGGSVDGLSRGAVHDRDPAISPDGSLILFSSDRNDLALINLYQADFAGSIVELGFFSSGDSEPSWSVVP